ncbi:acyl-CoA dehydrogenase FadE6 [Mycobacterium tuberculosis variant africanum MAL010102]|uniref:acyl-CoA dehydrogenase family protein n=1 Tax=Mycobacterium tuberculosis TaxID=1773 RepID=UPI0002177D7A|nr:acyl-CoA dehydrogenase family protein [Mycobacterium tuberculosis]AMC62078.1 acyl-CoA dehydrogenase FadE6 [Mycobacterium tuberculosis variant africanum]KBF90453.1 acyl-CoA dehydrogenase FadE6 [Mycobacterium tuberculosis variant africanum]KBF96728.1 acyl-CoA dehydrogenase FadE6 [Mycobacterium tuberculosis variant africanum]KBG09730.1 acyl-CoA dehydrogenase FadE6 [Mycobacterium tuberculosis variant africanum MAL010070]KBG17826.1 acyl-CoA dehydrogenase FadE6 [Mycobacterium tuberculosis variant
MSIAITPEHYELADSVRSLVARVAPSEVLHAALESPVENPPPYWQAAAEQGLQGVHLAESVGGQGFGILELAVVLAEFGYGAVPGPFVPSAIASALIAAHDPQAKVLAELATGAAIAAYALDSGLTATRHGDVLVIRGEVRAVPAAAQASVLVLPVAIESRDEWVVLRNDQLEIEAVKSLDPLRPIAHVRANAVDVSDDALLSNLTMTTAHALMSTLLSAEAVGVARWATDTASAYAKIREQFGRPIGQFQAIKHKCAEMIADTERATAAVWDAARALDDAGESSSDVEFAAAVAATLAPATAQRCTQDCIQVHGGIGFTWEHDTNVYYRRALMLAACFGRGSEYPQRVVDTATTAGMRPVDIDLDPSTEKLRAQIRAEVAALEAMPREPRTVAIAEGGWVLPYLPKPWGRAASPVEQIIIAQEFTAGRVKRPQIAIATWIVPSIVAFGTDNQKQRLLPPTFRGDIFWCQLFSEPGAGSDLASLATKATRVDGGWRITGQKIWTTGAQYSQWGALLARTDPSAPKHNGITYFLLDMKSEGVQVKPLRELTGKEFFNTVYLDDVFVPDELVLGEVNRGWEVSRNTLTAERVSIGGSDSTFLPTLGEFVDFVRDYRFEGQFDQVARHRAGQLIAEGHATKLLNLRSTLLTLAGGDPMAPAAISKLLSMRTGQGYAEFAVSSFGTDAVIGDTERLPGKWGEYLLASRATTIYGGTSEVQLNIIAERLLGLPRDP